MAVHTVVAILIAVGEVSSPMTQAVTDAMTGAVAEALGPETSLVLRTTPSPSDDEALAIERELGAAAIARVLWEGPDQTVGVLRAHVSSSDRWFERRVTFSAADSRTERGRTLGFAFASLLLTDRGPAVPPAPPEPAARPVPSDPNRLDIPVAILKAPPPGSEANEQTSGRVLAIEVAGLAATGLGGPARSLGASMHAEWALRGGLFARAGAAARIGQVPGLNGEDTLAGVGAGIAFRPWLPDAGKHALGFGFTLEVLGLYQDLSHRTASGSTLHDGRLLGGVTGGAEASWRMMQALDLFAGLGAEVVFSSTDIAVAGRHIATLPIVRPTAQLGLRWHD